MKTGKARWKVTLCTDSGSGRGSGFSPSRFDADGFRIAHAYHVQHKADALTIGENFVNKQGRGERCKAIVRPRWNAKKVTQVIYKKETDPNKGAAVGLHVIDPSSPTGYSTLSPL